MTTESRFASVLIEGASRFATDLSGRLGAKVEVKAGQAARGSAGALLPEIGEVVVALERTLAAPAATSRSGRAVGTPAPAGAPPEAPAGESPPAGPDRAPLFALSSGEAAAVLAAFAAGGAEASSGPAVAFDPERHREGARSVLGQLLQTAGSLLGPHLEAALDETVPEPKVFSLDRDLNRAVSFLGEGELQAARLIVSAGGAQAVSPGLEAAVWILARSDLAAALDARPPAEAGDRARRGGPPAGLAQAGVPHLLHISVPVIVTLAEKKMSVGEILGLTVGQVIEFDKSCDEFLELLVNDRVIGRGEVVKVGDRFGLRIVEIGDVRETIRKLGGTPHGQPP